MVQNGPNWFLVGYHGNESIFYFLKVTLVVSAQGPTNTQAMRKIYYLKDRINSKKLHRLTLKNQTGNSRKRALKGQSIGSLQLRKYA